MPERLPTAAQSGNTQNAQNTEGQKADQIDAINRVFAELELAYHNQYHKAFPTDQSVSMAKQLWLDSLRGYSAEVIVKACRLAISDSEYLPNLYRLNKHCSEQLAQYGLPDALNAYREACNAPSPKVNYAWSHPAIYFAGQASDWFLLRSEPEARMLPRFERQYQLLCQRVLQGEQFVVPEQARLEDEKASKELSNDEQRERLKALRKALKL